MQKEGTSVFAAFNPLQGHLFSVEFAVYSGGRCLLKNADVLNKSWY